MPGQYIFDLVAPAKLLAFYIVVGISFLYVVHRHGRDSLHLLIILCFYSGFAAYLGKWIENPYKILLVVMVVYLAFRYRVFEHVRGRYLILVFFFAVFSASFFLSSFINGDYWQLTFSQYGKYLTPFLVLLIFTVFYEYQPARLQDVGNLVFSLIMIQVALSVAKFLIMGVQESIVGSLAYVGGAPAAILPILGIVYLWFRCDGHFGRREWLLIGLLLFIGFASSKRAIWFEAPMVIFLFMVYVPRKMSIGTIASVVGLAVVIFYTGVRLNPSLNREHRVWGSFNLDFVVNYAMDYNFGKDPQRDPGAGRGGATVLLYDEFRKTTDWSSADVFGGGLNKIYTKNYEQFSTEDFGINSKGAATGMFQTFITSGYLGIICTVAYIISLVWCVRDKKIRYAFLALMLWDYVLYSGVILRTQALSILFFFLIIEANERFNSETRSVEDPSCPSAGNDGARDFVLGSDS